MQDGAVMTCAVIPHLNPKRLQVNDQRPGQCRVRNSIELRVREEGDIRFAAVQLDDIRSTTCPVIPLAQPS